MKLHNETQGPVCLVDILFTDGQQQTKLPVEWVTKVPKNMINVHLQSGDYYPANVVIDLVHIVNKSIDTVNAFADELDKKNASTTLTLPPGELPVITLQHEKLAASRSEIERLANSNDDSHQQEGC